MRRLIPLLLLLLACAEGNAPSSDANAAGASETTSSSGAGKPAAAAAAAAAASSSSPAAPASSSQSSIDAADASFPPPTLGTTSPQPLPVPEGFYPRAILRSDGITIVASVVRNLGQRMGATFFESTNNGTSFTEIGSINDPINDGGLCCGTLYELPKALGVSMPKGTLLWAASAGGDAPNSPMTIPMWKSLDGGRNWTFVSKVATGAVPRRNGGLWEPEFVQLDDGLGTLVCHWSDETQSAAYSQKLVEARTTDGLTWRDQRNTVAVSPQAHRPGMPNVRKAGPSGSYVLSYEICGVTNDSCTAWFRTSTDGWNWGDPTQRGFRPTTHDGKHFRHAPTLAWAAAPGVRGRYLMVGQITHQANGVVAPDNGRTIFANSEGGFQSWYQIAAPVPVPNSYDNFCPNYSSTLLPLNNGQAVLEIASRWDGNVCRSYFARGPLLDTSDANASEVVDGTNARFVSVMSGLCLDVAAGSAAAGANVQQWTCNGGNAQKWNVKRTPGAAPGVITLRSAISGMCLTVANGATSPGTNVEQQPCGGASAGQEWKLRGMGIDYYELIQHGAPNCLDVAGGSTSAGGNVAQWTCNDLAPQIWHLERL